MKKDNFYMKFSHTLNESNLHRIITRYGKVGIYVVNDKEDVDCLLQKVSEAFFFQHKSEFEFTSYHPEKVKKKLNDKSKIRGHNVKEE